MTSIKEKNLIIEEIHDRFYSEVDRILEDAKISKSLETDKQYLVDKCNRLKALGFKNSIDVKNGEIEIQRLEKIKTENENKLILIEAIDYFSFTYPNYKFITDESIEKICNKYKLRFDYVDNFKGEVPETNLKHIEEFKIKESDRNGCFRIVAPTSDFSNFYDFNSNKDDDIEDPIVLCPVKFKSLKAYLIVTAWGLESGDELVVNPRHN